MNLTIRKTCVINESESYKEIQFKNSYLTLFTSKTLAYTTHKYTFHISEK